MPINLALLFHFNQHITEFAHLASHVCYRGLLHVLHKHPRVKVNIHISGTLIHALQWLDPEPLHLINQGVASGQFEILGSTYAQNVPYATSDLDNAAQIALHQQVLRRVFDVSPTVFWNPERCWRQTLVPIIASAGYKATLIEDHILRRSGVLQPEVIETGLNGRSLNILYDDEILKHWFNLAAWTYRTAGLTAYLDERTRHPHASHHLVVYAEDAEAMGLWGWGQGLLPNQTWDHLDNLLSLLSARQDIQFIHLSEAPVPTRQVSPIADGSAAWMDSALQREDAPYHEDGYQNWFDFNQRAPKLRQYRRLYDGFREAIDAAAAAATAVSQPLVDAARHTFLAYQYEFGCIGIGGEGKRTWDGVYATTALLYAAHAAANPGQPNPVTLPATMIPLQNGRFLLITTPLGGRLLYWFDLTTGQQHIGNQLPLASGPFISDAHRPTRQVRPLPWMPPHTLPNLEVAGATAVTEPPPTRMAKFLPPWVWQQDEPPITFLTHPIWRPDQSKLAPAIQERAFVDNVTVDHQETSLPETWQTVTHSADLVTFACPLRDGLVLQKTFAIHETGVQVTYTMSNDTAESHTVHIRTSHELSPDYAAVVANGRSALTYLPHPEQPQLVNTKTGTAVTLRSQPSFTTPPDAQPGFMAWLVTHNTHHTLSSGEKFDLTITLQS